MNVFAGHLPHAPIWSIGGAAVGAAAGVLATNAASKTHRGASASDAGTIGGAAIGAILGLLADAGVSRLRPTYRLIYSST